MAKKSSPSRRKIHKREIPGPESPGSEKVESPDQVFERVPPALASEAIGATVGQPRLGVVLELLEAFDGAATIARSAGLPELAEHAFTGFDAAVGLLVAHRRGISLRPSRGAAR